MVDVVFCVVVIFITIAIIEVAFPVAGTEEECSDQRRR
jgi:biopolymer transport protein ExbD